MAFRDGDNKGDNNDKYKDEKEKLFYDTLEKIFTGADIQGKGGYINLLSIKHSYYKKVLSIFKKQIYDDVTPYIDNKAKEELFDRLYTFFKRYFSECGSVYYSQSAYNDKIYERVYTNKKDVVLFYKTSMLYYVKSEVLYHNAIVTLLDGNGHLQTFAFDVRELQNKKNNEKKDLVYSYYGYMTPSFITDESEAKTEAKQANTQAKENTAQEAFLLKVMYSENGTKTKIDDIAKKTKQNATTIKKAINVFEKQSSVDYFINKDVKKFLKEQLELYTNNILLEEKNEFTVTRLRQIKMFKTFANEIIDFVSQFENELLKVWQKPKFPLNSCYVITLDKLCPDIIQKVAKSAGLKQQIKEWQDLGMIEKDFDFNKRTKNQEHLPLDTKYFKEIEGQILEQFSDLDAALDGRLIHSENFQALNTLQNRYKEKVDMCYIDPPYNTASSEIDYNNEYKHSSWLSLMENRINLGKNLLKKSAFQAITIDYEELFNLGKLADNIFEKENRVGIVTIFINPKGRQHEKYIASSTEYMLVYAKDIGKGQFNNTTISQQKAQLFDLIDDIGKYRLDIFARIRGSTLKEVKPDSFYPIYVSDDLKTITLEKKAGFIPVYPTANGKDYSWKVNYSSFEKDYNSKNMIVAKKEGNKIVIYNKYYEAQVFHNIWTDKKYFPEFNGTNILKDMFIDKDFSYPKSVFAVEDTIKIMSPNDGLVLDYFAGSGTTAHAVINLNKDGSKRKYILMEVNGYFYNVLVPRIKKLCYSDKWKEGKAQEGGKGVSQFFKYYDTEQYEDTLRKMHYKDSDIELFDQKEPFASYVFLTDEKFSYVLDIKQQKNKEYIAKLDFSKLYPNIDFPETISLLRGQPIKKIIGKTVVLDDGTKEGASYSYDFENMTFEQKIEFLQMLKPFLWWGQ